MDRSFENIFEKYNITCSNHKKRSKASKTSKQIYAFPKNSNVIIKKNKSAWKNVLANNKVPLTTNSSFCYNTNTLGKYDFIPRYNTLDTAPVKSIVCHRVNCSTESTLWSENVLTSINEIGKENCSAYGVLPVIEKEADNLTESGDSPKDLNLREITSCNNTVTNISTASKNSLNKRNLSCSFNFGKRKKNCLSRVQSRHFCYNKLHLTVVSKKRNDLLSLSTKDQPYIEALTSNVFDNLDAEIQPTVNSTPQHSKTIDIPTKPLQNSGVNDSEELDLLIDLIERDERYKKSNCYKSNYNDNLPASKSFLKGGYEELFERTLKSEIVRGNFLKHDRKYGLRVGKLLTVVKLETSYGFTIAVVKSEDFHKNFAVAVAQKIVPQLQEGTKIEVFFDEKSIPYKLQFNDDYLDVYLEPYKMLVV